MRRSLRYSRVMRNVPQNLVHAAPALALAAALASCSSSRPSPAAPSASASDPAPGTSKPGDSGAETGADPEPEAAKRLPEPTDTLETSAGPVRITPIQHGTLALSFDGKTVVVDPWSKAPDGWLPKADLVLLTDVHPDHFDEQAIATVRKPTTVFVAPPAVAEKLPAAEVLRNGEETSLLGITIHAVPMYNEKRGPEPGKVYHEKGRGNGYVLTFGDERVYLSGDTECIPEMRALEDIDLAFVSMNLPYTMPPEEAAACVQAFKPKVVIPYHYRGSDLEVFKNALSLTDGVDVRIRDFYPAGEG
jgi:L-ascorbate metabolism protein UlaG (beta-lactamase superfamily)